MMKNLRAAYDYDINVRVGDGVPPTTDGLESDFRELSDTDGEVVYEQGDVTCLSYDECAQGATTEFCIVDGGGHTWPGAIDIFALDPEAFPWAGVTTQNVDASQRMWEFFDRHPKPQ